MTVEIADCYLGDGVYAVFDGYHIILDLRGQDKTTRIALEPAVIGALVEYNLAVHRQLTARSAEQMQEAKAEAKNQQ